MGCDIRTEPELNLNGQEPPGSKSNFVPVPSGVIHLHGRNAVPAEGAPPLRTPESILAEQWVCTACWLDASRANVKKTHEGNNASYVLAQLKPTPKPNYTKAKFRREKSGNVGTLRPVLPPHLLRLRVRRLHRLWQRWARLVRQRCVHVLHGGGSDLAEVKARLQTLPPCEK